MADSFALSYRLLQERLAEVEAERDRWQRLAQEWNAHVEGQAARLAEVEAERDALLEAAAVREHDYDELASLRADHLARCAGRLDRLKAAEARLAAVEALCDEHDGPYPNPTVVLIRSIRAAARGEGDRP